MPWLLVLWVTSGSTLSALDPAKTIDQYPREVWTVEQGLPQSSVETIMQSTSGYLWFGTQEGVARFDGLSFKVLDRGTTPELGENVVASVAEGLDGSLWIGTTRGVCRLAGGVATGFGKAQGLPGRGVRAVLPVSPGEVWFGTRNGGLAIWRDGVFRTVGKAQGLVDDGVWCLQRGPDGAVWVGTAGGVSRVRGQSFTSFGREQGLPGPTVRAMCARRDGSVWAGTDQGLARLEGDRFVTVLSRAQVGNAAIYSLLEDRDGSLWIASYGGGLCRLSVRGFERSGEKDGFPSDVVRSLLEDREGNLWVGTAGSGVVRLKDAAFTTLLPRHGVAHELVTSVLEDASGTLWVGTFGGGLGRLTQGRWSTWTVAQGLPSNNVWSLAVDRSGDLWAGTLDNGLARLRGHDVTAYSTRNGLPSDSVRAMLEDREGNMWVATRLGLVRIRGSAITVLGSRQGLSSDSVYCLHEDRQGRLWMGTSLGGVCRLDGDKVVTFPEAGGPAGETVYDIHEEPDGTMWFSTAGAGIFRYRDGRFGHVTTRDGLFDNTGYRLLAEPEGTFWLSCNRGIFRVAKAELDELLEGRRSKVTCTVFGSAEGLGSPEANGGSQPAGWRGKDGRLWFPTVRGLAVVDPTRMVVNSQAPPVVIEELVSDGESLGSQSPIRLGPGRTKLEFRYAGLSFRNPGKVHFRYRLGGFDREWIDAGTRRAAYYTNVPPGAYQFEVTACNEDGAWSSAPATLAVTLTPPFWATWWFRVAALGALAALVLGAYWARVHHLEAERRTLERLVSERTVELAASRDQLAARGAQLERTNAELKALNEQKNEFLGMAAHDLRSPLGLITGWTEVVRRSLQSGRFGADRAAKELGRVVTVAEQMTRLVTELLDVSAIESGTLNLSCEPVSVSAILEDCTQLFARLAADKGIELTLDGGQRLPPVLADKDRITEVVNNLLSNALKFTPSGGRVRLWCEAGDGLVETSVEDSGPGLSEEDLKAVFRRFGRLSARPTAGETSTGLGLAIVKKIVDAHGGQVRASSAPGRGARFSFTLPTARPESPPRSADSTAT